MRLFFCTLLLISFTSLNAQNSRLYFTDAPIAESNFDGEELVINDGVKPERNEDVRLLVTYHPNGEVAEIGQVVDNKPDGVWRRYDKNGKIVSQVRYKDGIKRGKWIVRDQDGKLLAKGRYDVNGSKKGVWTYWSSTDNKHYKGSF